MMNRFRAITLLLTHFITFFSFFYCQCRLYYFVLFFFFLIIRPPPRSTLFPYPTLSRSLEDARQCGIAILGLDVNASEKEYVVEPFETVAERPPQEPPFETVAERPPQEPPFETEDRKTTRLNSSHSQISYAVFCLKKKRY